MSLADRERYARDRERIRARQTVYAAKSREKNSTREFARSTEWRAWQAMKHRCLNPKQENFKYYGGRGVTICREWLESFDAFLLSMGGKPSPMHTLDRIDPNGNYEPSNCRWATWKEQRANRRDSRRAA